MDILLTNDDGIYAEGIRVLYEALRDLGNVTVEERFDKREDPRMRTYYWLTGEIIKSDGHDDADIEAIRNNYISITPIRCDMTDYGFMEELK